MKMSIIDDDNTVIANCKSNIVILNKNEIAINVAMESPANSLLWVNPDQDNLFRCYLNEIVEGLESDSISYDFELVNTKDSRATNLLDSDTDKYVISGD
jgi:hypothetical protein